jgi:hypothetical protein
MHVEAPVADRPRSNPLDSRVSGSAVVYRLYDVGYEIDLEQASQLLASGSVGRARPVQREAQAFLIRNPPVTVNLGIEPVLVRDKRIDAELSARIFDFGVVSLRLRVPAPPGLSWPEFTEFGIAVDVETDLTPLFARRLAALVGTLGPAIARPALAAVTEDYVVFRITSLCDTNRHPISADELTDDELAALLLDEHRPLSAAAKRELLPHRFSYYVTDVAILTWHNALVVEAAPEEADVQFVLEFANAQLLELRMYDAMLDDELPRLNARVTGARGRRWRVPRGYAAILGELQTLVADSTELVERVENSFKVTDDVYLARVYSAAIEIFRGPTWRQGIDRKLATLRDTYSMLHSEAQAWRAEILELAVILLILAELVAALWRH